LQQYPFSANIIKYKYLIILLWSIIVLIVFRDSLVALLKHLNRPDVFQILEEVKNNINLQKTKQNYENQENLNKTIHNIKILSSYFPSRKIILLNITNNEQEDDEGQDLIITKFRKIKSLDSYELIKIEDLKETNTAEADKYIIYNKIIILMWFI
jgi:hypothetical protein